MSEKRLENTALVGKSMGRLLPVPSLGTIAATLVVGFLIYAFFAGITMQFYASFVFLFYSWTRSMWISVIFLGVFQTLLMIPFRIVNLLKSQSLEVFKESAEQQAHENDQYFVKKQFKRGGGIALYYVVNFFVALVSYTSIGRLFLTDFYTVKLDPRWLYAFVPYPEYPILDRWFRIPYAWFSGTHDYGIHVAYWVWGILLVIQILVYIGVYMARRKKVASPAAAASITKWTAGNLIILLLVSWLLVRHSPSNWTLRIFSGDVGFPNPRFNSLTAIMTFITLIWTNLPKIRSQIEEAEAAGFEPAVIHATQKKLLAETFKVATVVGLGAYYITNLIPCAFELSIFTLEIISTISPLTLDRLILGGMKNRAALAAAEEKTKEPN